LGYQFNNENLLNAALSHRSVSGSNNERLEFLGDSILNFIVSEELYQRYPAAREGDLSRLRAALVKGETLSRIALGLDIGGYLHLGSGELKSGGFRRESILADALEAIIAAIYLDADLNACRQCILHWLQDEFNQLVTHHVVKDAKTRLQEYLQSRRLALPIYDIVKVEGEAHAQLFYVECRVDNLSLRAEASGSNRRKAEQVAAELLLAEIEENEHE